MLDTSLWPQNDLSNTREPRLFALLCRCLSSARSTYFTSALVWRVANKANELELQCVIPVRVANLTAHPVIDIITAGYRNFQTSSLATVNKKIADMKQGKPSQPEANEITPCQVVETIPPGCFQHSTKIDCVAVLRDTKSPFPFAVSSTARRSYPRSYFPRVEVVGLGFGSRWTEVTRSLSLLRVLKLRRRRA
jgi:hypothetical protein